MVQLPYLTPQYLLALTALVLLLYDTISPNSRQNGVLAGIATTGGLLTAAVSAWFLAAGTGLGSYEAFSGALVVDQMSLFFTFIVGSVTTLVVVASYDYVRDEPHIGEYYSLVALAATGMALMGAANSLVTVFVSLELASLPSYALVGYLKTNKGSVEAALKYFLVGALSSAIMVYGISLIYGVTGTLLLDGIGDAVVDLEPGLVGILGLGVLMMTGGFLFKTAAVPFHFWAPDAYEGAPAPISGFISSASKAAGFAVAFRVLLEAFPIDVIGTTIPWTWLFVIVAAITMTLGNFAAAVQENVKRMLAYSSVGHAGYVLIGLAAIGGGTSEADTLVLGAAMMHLLVYGFMNTGAFLFIALAEYWGVGRTFEDYNGLARRAPVASLAMTVFMFSLAGLPVGAGFLSKYFLFAGAIQAGFWWLAAIAAVNSALSLYYYSRVVKAIWIEEPVSEISVDRTPTGIYLAVIGAAVVTVGLLFAFDPVAQWAIDAAAIVL
ncbi:NADH-quinone oxidoreductase subunit N [Halanaeroarchaeum sulfurireducens]|uniref:NADH-quinone oxidoreductase subunit N n=1 Tax=Halanaeroarchaeum sulfurireducens TaxID=1604004 RepID=A0A0F7PAG1_9EURY|nr:NADH-quinone oxidoreductase subunit N [Halanaeroarchaeum sulfurireducens]AKH97712.1 NADH-quinone oxidoreductase subunit N [Halanaeroarchaeum sulfurireducens]ALG82107.1 NADH-quinone oxidoreductase subunit N [Halanaeroarchaeum sulfurireducens]